ncbi:M23 family metallopeptidase [Novosphingobium colocasiae]|uniref:M23 family metallopeptidase n=1 Tax=Novosphingobium colocasiae TaxID=1256513 RepID=UPI0035B4295A
MFKAIAQDHAEALPDSRSAIADLSHDQVLNDDGGDPVAAEPCVRAIRSGPSFADRVRARVLAFEHWCHRIDLAPDLATDIGSRRWYRGFLTLSGLTAAALAFWPDFSSVEAATTMPVNAASRDEFLSQTIAPIALGSDTGRHMGATLRVRPLSSVPERPQVQLVATLAQGDSFARMLERVGVGPLDAGRAAALVGQTMPLDQIAPGTQFDITLGRRPAGNQPRALQDMAFRARFDLDLSVRRAGGSDGALALVRHPVAVDATPLRIRGTVGQSLYLSARNAGAPIAAIQSYLQAIDRQVSLQSDVSPGDTFDMILSYRRSARGERQVGDLLYAGIEHGGKPSVQLLAWGKDHQLMPSPDSVQSTTLSIGAPVAGRITSLFGMRRHPILGYVRMHAGVDFGAAWGSPIYAVADGVVNYAGPHGGHGNYVRLDNGGGIGTGYAHMSRIAVSYGMRVRAGQVIGYVGSSGLSTGPHLHFEAYRNGQVVNPLGMRFVSRPTIDPAERTAYRARLDALMKVRPGAALGDMAPSHADGPATAMREIDRLSGE